MKIWNKDLSFSDRTNLIEQIKILCEEYSSIFDLVVLFGSTARGTHICSSDIDIYIESDSLTSTKLLQHKKFREFEYRLFDIVSDVIDFDILSYGRNELKNVRESLLYSQVQKDGVILYDSRTKDV